MIIGIDGSRAFIREKTGVEEYSYQVIKNLAETRSFKDPKNKVVLYLRKEQKVDFKLPKNWKVKNLNWPKFWTQFGLSLEMFFYPVDVLFISAHIAPLIHPKKTFVVIHGLEYETVKESYSAWSRFYMRWLIKLSCSWSKKIIAVSKNTKKDLVDLYAVPENKIKVIYEGTSLSKDCSSNNLNKIDKDLQQVLENKYLFFMGRLEKRKNVSGIISAFEILKDGYQIPHKLILAGKAGFGYEEIKNKIDNSKYKDEIIEVGFVSDEKKCALLRNADVFLFATFYEGFGLPILEAQAIGIPVVTSNISSMPEIGGDGVAYCNPEEPISIAGAIHKVVSDENFKESLIKKGHENIKRFDWKKCAEEIAEVLVK